ncbi:MAG: FAD binding domain-containing protein, partial [bacterium]
FFQKVGSRQALVISKVVIACKACVDEKKQVHSIQIGIGSVAPTVIRLRQTEALLQGQVLAEELIESTKHQAEQEVRPITDVRSNEHYRRTITGNVLARFLRQLLE